MNFNPTTFQTQAIFTPEAIPSTASNGTDKTQEVREGLKNLDRKLDRVSQEVGILKEIMCKHTVLLEALGKVSRPSCIDLQIFPINSLVELNSAEELIKTKSELEVINYMKSMFGEMKLEKVLPKIFNDNILLKINWDGLKQKIAINKYKLFTYFFFESVKGNFSSYGDFEKAMKIAFRKCKATFYRKTYSLKSATSVS